MREVHVFLSNGGVQIKEINQWGSKLLVEWSYAIERVNERGTYM